MVFSSFLGIKAKDEYENVEVECDSLSEGVRTGIPDSCSKVSYLLENRGFEVEKGGLEDFLKFLYGKKNRYKVLEGLTYFDKASGEEVIFETNCLINDISGCFGKKVVDSRMSNYICLKVLKENGEFNDLHFEGDTLLELLKRLNTFSRIETGKIIMPLEKI